MERAGTAEGIRTVLHLRLQRRDLVERRIDRIRQLSKLVAQSHVLPGGPTKDLLETVIRAEASDGGQYAAAGRSYLLAELGWAIPEVDNVAGGAPVQIGNAEGAS